MRAGLANSIRFDPADPRASLGGLPEAPAVFALCAADPAAEPYLSKTPNLRRRLMRFLRGPQTAEGQSEAPRTKRLQLAHMVDHIEYTVTGSEFESSLCLYQASLRAFGDRAKKRLRLRPPVFLRMSVDNAYPRVYVTAKISKTAANALFGPFPSRAAAERYADEMLNLFLLRRCTEDLNPDPAFPGCVYSEMKMCLAPCYKGCSDERYGQESAEVFAFLSTRGASMLARLEGERNAASEAMEFEQAAAIHQRMQKVQAVAHLASEAVHPLAQLSGVLVQPSAELDHVALFALRRGVWSGPALYSILGMRLANERSGSSSLFAHPVRAGACSPGGHAGHRRERCAGGAARRGVVGARSVGPEIGLFADFIGPRGAVHAMVLPACSAVHRGDDLCWSGWRGGAQAFAARYLPRRRTS